MSRWKLWFVLLLKLTFYIDSKAAVVNLVKTIGSEPDVTPICTNETLNNIMLIVCKIRTERNGGYECRLLYYHQKDFEHGCDSRFRLMTENQTAFLHLTSLTPEDSGNYTCQCSHASGTNFLHVNITVEEDEDSSSSTQTIPIPGVLIGLIVVVVMTGVILGFLHKTKCNGDSSRSAPSGSPGCEAPYPLDHHDPHDTDTSLQQPASDLYQTVLYSATKIMTDHLDNQEVFRRETDQSCTMYENI